MIRFYHCLIQFAFLLVIDNKFQNLILSDHFIYLPYPDNIIN